MAITKNCMVRDFKTLVVFIGLKESACSRRYEYAPDKSKENKVMRGREAHNDTGPG